MSFYISELVWIKTHWKTLQTGTMVYLHSCTTRKHSCQWKLVYHSIMQVNESVFSSSWMTFSHFHNVSSRQNLTSLFLFFFFLSPYHLMTDFFFLLLSEKLYSELLKYLEGSWLFIRFWFTQNFLVTLYDCKQVLILLLILKPFSLYGWTGIYVPISV